MLQKICAVDHLLVACCSEDEVHRRELKSAIKACSSMGRFMAASNSKIYSAFDPATTAATALCDGIALANQIRVHRHVIQSDCQDVLNTMMDSNSLLHVQSTRTLLFKHVH